MNDAQRALAEPQDLLAEVTRLRNVCRGKEEEIAHIRMERNRLRSLAQWLVSLDEPGSTDRRTVNLSLIIEQAREALSG